MHEHFRYIMPKHKTIWCPSKIIEDGVSLRFFSVDLSRRKAVLLRGGPHWKDLGVESTRIRLFLLHHLSFGSFEHSLFLRISVKGMTSSVAKLGHVVVLLLGAVVPQVLAVIPLFSRGNTASLTR